MGLNRPSGLRSIRSRSKGREVASEDGGKKLLIASAFSSSVVTSSPVVRQEGYAFLTGTLIYYVGSKKRLNFCFPLRMYFKPNVGFGWRFLMLLPLLTPERPIAFAAQTLH